MRYAILPAVLLTSCLSASAETPSSALERFSKALGATDLKSLQYSGSGQVFAVGQSPRPDAPWPKFNAKSYSRLINYESPALREELVRTQADPPRGGGGQPVVGEQRVITLVSGNYAWNLAGNTAIPVPTAVQERRTQIWLTPHGLLKAAAAHKATVKSARAGGKKVTAISFGGPDNSKFSALVNDQSMVEKTEAWVSHSVLGQMHIETTFSDYRDFNGVKFPTRIVQKQGGFPALDLTVTEVQANPPAEIQAPENVRQASASPVRVESQKLADGVWYLTGGSHHSVAVEFNDHVAVIEAPQAPERSAAVIAEVRKAAPNKPIRYVINTHHHFDHCGGLRGYVSEGAAIITHETNGAFYRKLMPKARIQTFGEKHVLSDGARTLELHHIQGNAHHDGILLAYMPKEKILVEADVFTPPPPNAPPPATPNPFSVNLYENLQRLKLEVEQIAPLHGRLVTLKDLEKAIGR